MSGDPDFNKQYSYDAMSNKVIQSEHRRKNSNDDSTPKSMVGRITMKDIGERASKSEVIKPVGKESRKKSKPLASRGQFDYSYTSSMESILYYPTNEETAYTYDLILDEVRKLFPDSSHDIILSAADSTLEILKDEDKTVSEKKKEIMQLLDTELTDIEFNDLFNLAKNITDYKSLQSQEEEEDNHVVAIDFDDDEENGNEIDYEIELSNDEVDDTQVQKAADVKQIDERHSDSEEIVIASKEDANDKHIPLEEIDELYLLRRLSETLVDQDQQLIEALNKQILNLVSDLEINNRDLENELLDLFNYDHLDLVTLLLENRWKLVFKIRWLKDESKESIIADMRNLHLDELIIQLDNRDSNVISKRRIDEVEDNSKSEKKLKRLHDRQPRILDLDSLTRSQDTTKVSSTVKLPKGSYAQQKKSYDLVFVPAPEPPNTEANLIPTTELPKWAQEAFPSNETTHFNRIQSKVFPQAYRSDESLLVCAPTGAGKTNIAILTILRVLDNHRNEHGKINIENFKVVYIAPLKALVQEQMREFERRLTPTFGVVVNELTGDSSLSKQQIAETQILVTTPEKWDIVTRKNSEYAKLTKLIIIDEIHLLHDERGPVLESIVSRTLRKSDQTGEAVRLVGLSATLPNFEDVARFLRVDLEKGLFYFDASFRPCPLGQQYIGIKEKKAIKKLSAMNEACYEKLLDCMENKHQMIIFVHSRNETYKTAKWLRDKLNLEDRHLISSQGSKAILKSEAEDMSNRHLIDIIPSGIGIHNAGLNRAERSIVEDLFAQGHLQVLVSTATLAWGVNLPAHTVIVKGTDTYSPAIGSWVQLSPQDILQMLGRAGRPRYDKSGEGVIITSKEDIQYYLAILNQQLPIESQLISKLVDCLNGEVVLGSVNSREEAITWLGYTYLYVRMLRSPAEYRVGPNYSEDKSLYWMRCDLAHTALSILHENRLVNYDAESGEVKATELGRIASYFYIGYKTMNMFNTKLKSWTTDIDLLRIFSSSGEFKYIPVRQEERLEVSKLIEKCPIPIKEQPSDSLAKVNVLLQTYISRFSLDGFALMSDMVYIVQSAARLLRAIHEISLYKKWPSVSKLSLNLCKMVEQRMWSSNSPFRQFGSLVPKEIIRTTENSFLPFVTYIDLEAEELAEALNFKGNSTKAFEFLRQFPRLNLGYFAQPITPSLLRVQLEIIPKWNWNSNYHSQNEIFLMLVENCNGTKILHSDNFTVAKPYIGKEHFVEFFIPLLDPIEPVYFVSFLSEKWIQSEWKIPIVLSDMKIPKKFPAFTELEGSQNFPTSAVKVPEYIETFNFSHFNRFQSQLFSALYKSTSNLFIGLSKGSGKTACAELAILNNWSKDKDRIIYICPIQEKVDILTKDWSKKYKHLEKRVGKLCGDITKDLEVLNTSHLILSTPEFYDALSRRWRQRKAIQAIDLLIADDVHTIGSGVQGAKYETCISRMRLIGAQLNKDIRIIALSSPLANGRDFGEWIGCSKHEIFNFSPENRFNKIQEIRLQSVSSDKIDSTMTLLEQAYPSLMSHRLKGSIIFVSTRKQCVNVATEIISKTDDSLLKGKLNELNPFLNKVTDKILREVLSSGVGYYYCDMHQTDWIIVEKLFQNNILSVLVCTKDSATYCPSASNIVILGTQEYYGKEHRQVDYLINDMLEMVGCCKDNVNNEGSVLVFATNHKVEFYKKFLCEGLPIESGINNWIFDCFMYEISTRTFKTRQDCIDWITYTYFYRRLQINPSFYDVKNTTHTGISEYLSELVESALSELEESNLVEIEEEEENEDEQEKEQEDDFEELMPTNTCMIASHYNVSYRTMKNFNTLDNKTKLKGLLYIIASASEFENIPIRRNEETTLKRIYQSVPMKVEEDYESTAFKTFILLQAHFSRITLPTDLSNDLQYILKRILPVIFACVDTLSSEGYLNALNAMDISQMIIQAVWNRDSPLKQIPNINEGMIERAKKYEVETVYDIMSLEDDERDDLLQLQGEKLNQVAEFVNKYPNIETSYELNLTDSAVIANEPHDIIINLNRDEDSDDLTVESQFYCQPKSESWWVVIGDFNSKQLYAIKKTVIAKEKQQLKLEFTIPNPGHHKLSIWCICDSYLDADKEISLEIDVEPEQDDQ